MADRAHDCWRSIEVGFAGNIRLNWVADIWLRCRDECEWTKFENKGWHIDAWFNICFPTVGCFKPGLTRDL